MVDWIATSALGTGLGLLIAGLFAAYVGKNNLGAALGIAGALEAILGARWFIENGGRNKR